MFLKKKKKTTQYSQKKTQSKKGLGVWLEQ
jgi:hypothetical protein